MQEADLLRCMFIDITWLEITLMNSAPYYVL